jgi:hypothetical protein
MKLKTGKTAYVGLMALAFVALDLAGVSHLDKLALSALFGALAPLYAPRLSARLLGNS